MTLYIVTYEHIDNYILYGVYDDLEAAEMALEDAYVQELKNWERTQLSDFYIRPVGLNTFMSEYPEPVYRGGGDDELPSK